MNTPQHESQQQGKAYWGFARFVLSSLAAQVFLFMHIGMGRNYPGVYSIGVLLGPLFAMVFSGRGVNPLGVLALFYLNLLALAVQRSVTLWKRRQGILEHSQFYGRPWPWIGTKERVFGIWGGMAVVAWLINGPLGGYLLLCLLAAIIDGFMDEHHLQLQAERIYDAEIESTVLHGRAHRYFREG
jgi:hypothetical protein